MGRQHSDQSSRFFHRGVIKWWVLSIKPPTPLTSTDLNNLGGPNQVWENLFGGGGGGEPAHNLEPLVNFKARSYHRSFRTLDSKHISCNQLTTIKLGAGVLRLAGSLSLLWLSSLCLLLFPVLGHFQKRACTIPFPCCY